MISTRSPIYNFKLSNLISLVEMPTEERRLVEEEGL